MNDIDVILTTENYFVRSLTFKDKNILQALCEKCADYFELAEGLPVGKINAGNLFTDLPPGKNLDDKFLLGILYQEEFVGLLEIVRNYPVEKEWIIGLFIIDPKYRRRGVGMEVHIAVEEWAAALGAKKIWIGVVEQNINAYRFWNNIGYKEVKRTGPKKTGNKENIIVVMNYELI